MSIEFPITVNRITFDKGETLHQAGLTAKCGDMVAVMPCDKEYGGKTFLGVYLGDIALSCGAAFDKATGELVVSHCMYNPAIFIPERNAIVYGCGSFWNEIENESQLRQITDADIQDVWYVRALKAICDRENAGRVKRK